MKRSLIALACILCQLTLASAQVNPVIPGFHPDPSICRVGGDYYVVNSSFQYFPGVPIFHSTDLQSWRQVGNVLTRASQLPLRGASSWQGIYAPTLRHHDGTWYMITTNVNGGGNFMVTAQKPEGPWSEPIWLQQQGIDPSLLFDGGKCYMVSNPNDNITLCEIDPKTGRQLTQSRSIWTGTGGRYPEGPHIYRKDGYYYLLISEGGTELAHSITIARSRNIYGPYEANPDNPILTHCNQKGQTSQVQGTGHGDLVQDAQGRWWMVFLAYRNYNGSYHHLGRETFIAPVEWTKNGWPVVNHRQPIVPRQRQAVTERCDFDSPLDAQWVYLQNPVAQCYDISGGRLRLVASRSSLTDNRQPTFVGRRQEAPCFAFTALLTDCRLDHGDEAGMTVYQINDGHAEVCLQRQGAEYAVALKLTMKSVSTTLAEHTAWPAEGKVWLRVSSDSKAYRYEYSLDGNTFQYLGQVDCPLLSTEAVGGFTGVTLGLYAQKASDDSCAYADFDYVEYREMEQ